MEGLIDVKVFSITILYTLGFTYLSSRTNCYIASSFSRNFFSLWITTIICFVNSSIDIQNMSIWFFNFFFFIEDTLSLNYLWCIYRLITWNIYWPSHYLYSSLKILRFSFVFKRGCYISPSFIYFLCGKISHSNMGSNNYDIDLIQPRSSGELLLSDVKCIILTLVTVS